MDRTDDTPVEYGLATEHDLAGILALQALNLEGVLAPDVVEADGFVTLRHDLGLLREMNDAARHVVARADGEVVGYALVLLREFAGRFPALAPMFARLRGLESGPLAGRRWFVVGQDCVAERFRGRGVFGGLFEEMRRVYSASFARTLTIVAERNQRSIRAHAKVGFESLLRYRDGAENWDLIAWDWT